MSHPTVEQALNGGFYHIDSGGFDVIVDTGSDRASTVDTKNAERDMSSHVAWGVGCFEALETAYALLDTWNEIVAQPPDPGDTTTTTLGSTTRHHAGHSST